MCIYMCVCVSPHLTLILANFTSLQQYAVKLMVNKPVIFLFGYFKPVILPSFPSTLQCGCLGPVFFIHLSPLYYWSFSAVNRASQSR